MLQYIGNRIKESVSDLFQPNKTAKPNINKIVHHLKEAEGKKNKKNTCFTIRNICLLIESSAHNEGSSLGPMHRSIGPVKIITCVQKLDTCQDLNGSSAPVHWTQSFPHNENERTTKKKLGLERAFKSIYRSHTPHNLSTNSKTSFSAPWKAATLEI